TAPISTSSAPVTAIRPETDVDEVRSDHAIRPAAPPPTALNTLTSWGMAVIATRWAAYRPATPPTAAPAASISQPVAVMVPAGTRRPRVVAPATAIAAADSRLPRRAEAGEFIRCRPSTKHAAVAR